METQISCYPLKMQGSFCIFIGTVGYLGNGKIVKHEVETYAGGLSLNKLIVRKDTLVSLDSAKPTIITSDIAKGEMSLHQTMLSSLFEYFSFEAQLLPLKFVGDFALKVDSHILLIKVGNTCSELHLLEKVSELVIISDGLFLSPKEQSSTVLQCLDKNKVSLTVVLDNGQKNEILRLLS